MSDFQGTWHTYHTMLRTMSVIFSSTSFICPTYSTVLLRDGHPEHSTLFPNYKPFLNLETQLHVSLLIVRCAVKVNYYIL